MTRVVSLLVALLAACSALWVEPARSHGLHHDAATPATFEDGRVGVAARAATSRDAGARASIARNSGCPADDGLPCACGADRCANPQPPRILLADMRVPGVARAPELRRDVRARHERSLTRPRPPGSVGSRAPPASS